MREVWVAGQRSRVRLGEGREEEGRKVHCHNNGGWFGKRVCVLFSNILLQFTVNYLYFHDYIELIISCLCKQLNPSSSQTVKVQRPDLLIALISAV